MRQTATMTPTQRAVGAGVQEMQVPGTIEIATIREIATGVAQRAFCYDAPTDFRAGVEAIVHSIETVLAQDGRGADDDADETNHVARAG